MKKAIAFLFLCFVPGLFLLAGQAPVSQVETPQPTCAHSEKEGFQRSPCKVIWKGKARDKDPMRKAKNIHRVAWAGFATSLGALLLGIIAANYLGFGILFGSVGLFFLGAIAFIWSGIRALVMRKRERAKAKPSKAVLKLLNRARIPMLVGLAAGGLFFLIYAFFIS